MIRPDTARDVAARPPGPVRHGDSREAVRLRDRGVFRSARVGLSAWGVCAVIGSLVACVPPAGAWSAQPGWRAPAATPSPSASDEEEEHSEGPARAGGGSWLCAAEANVATRVGTTGDWEDGPISIMSQGATRDDAYDAAFSDCNALVTTQLAIMDSGDTTAETRSECRVTECNHL